MNGRTLTATTIGAAVAFVVLCAAFLILSQQGIHRSVQVIPVALAWAAALVALRPLVTRDHLTPLYFAFGVMAFMIYFLYETYGYAGKVRTFPLVIGYAGVVLSMLDILSLTDTRLGHGITRFFGAALVPEENVSRKVSRELIVFAAMGLSVLGIYLFGFLLAGPVFVMLWMLIGGGKSLKHSLYGGEATLFFVYVLFELVLRYELFRGIVVVWILEMIDPS
jgi:hypothetical protein